MTETFVAKPQDVDAPITTRAWIVHPEDGTQALLADFDDWQVVVFQGSRSEPILSLLGQDISEVLTDTPRAWDINPRGFTFEHVLRYGADYDGALFYPVVGAPVRLEYKFNRTDDRGPIKLTKIQPVVDSFSANYVP